MKYCIAVSSRETPYSANIADFESLLLNKSVTVSIR